MSEQSNGAQWVGGLEKRNQEFKLLRSRPLSTDEIKTVCEMVKGFVEAFDGTFGHARLVHTSRDTSGTQEANEVLDKINSIESRVDREATMWELIAVKRLLQVLGRAHISRWNAWIASGGCWLGAKEAEQMFEKLRSKHRSCMECLNRIPSGYVITQLEPVIEPPSQSSDSMGLDGGSLIDTVAKVTMRFQWLDKVVTPDESLHAGSGFLQTVLAAPSEAQQAESCQGVETIELSGNDRITERTALHLSNFRLPSPVKSEFLRRWEEERGKLGDRSLFEGVDGSNLDTSIAIAQLDEFVEAVREAPTFSYSSNAESSASGTLS